MALSFRLLFIPLALAIMGHKARSVGLQLNWSKTKIQSTDASFPPSGTVVPVAGDNVEVVES